MTLPASQAMTGWTMQRPWPVTESGFQVGLEERCCHIQVIFDRFRIVQHFNREVVDRAREDEQARMIKERLSMPTRWRMRPG